MNCQTISHRVRTGLLMAGLSVACLQAALAADTDYAPDMGKLLATGGVSEVEGAGGGGLTPWALISGYGTRDSYGANAHYTRVQLRDYSLDTYGVAIGLYDRVELSFAHQEFKGIGSGNALRGVNIRQDITGIKVKVAGDAVYDQDSWLPQIAVGAMLKDNQGFSGGVLDGANPLALGAKDTSDTDYYVSATKIVLDKSLLLNGTLRYTRANQFGLLGFGGDRHDSYQAAPEFSAAYLLNRQWVAGVEYRVKPRSLEIGTDENAYDAFVAYFPSKHVSLTAAYVNLGHIVSAYNQGTQQGPYLSVQVGF